MVVTGWEIVILLMTVDGERTVVPTVTDETPDCNMVVDAVIACESVVLDGVSMMVTCLCVSIVIVSGPGISVSVLVVVVVEVVQLHVWLNTTTDTDSLKFDAATLARTASMPLNNNNVKRMGIFQLSGSRSRRYLTNLSRSAAPFRIFCHMFQTSQSHRRMAACRRC